MSLHKPQIAAQDWDVVVIGGGPAGMMAAVTAAEKGAQVLLIEKNSTLGKKLLITGGGRCNLTNSEADIRTLLSKYKAAKEFLFSPFSQWGNKKSREFFESRGCPTKVENEGRVFPVSNSAQSVWDVLVHSMQASGVTILADTPVMGFKPAHHTITGVHLNDGSTVTAKSFILATGGKSRPETGSTGDGFTWVRDIGHTIEESSAALVPLAVQEEWVSRLSGLTLTDVKINVIQEGVKILRTRGKILFTHVGLSGPSILNMSKDIGELLEAGGVELAIDLLPNLAHDALNTTLQDIFKEHDKKKFKNSLTSLLPTALVPIIVDLSKVDAEKSANAVTREERLRLIDILKNFSLHISHLLGLDKAVITSGGVTLSEVDTKTMRSTLYTNLYFAGDILDIDRPTGGYGLELCWTTGHVAGSNAH